MVKLNNSLAIQNRIQPDVEAQKCLLQTVIVVRIFILCKMCELDFR